MALDLKDVLSEFDITPADLDKLTLEDIRKARDEKFIGRAVAHTDPELVNKITGQRIGGLETAVKRTFKDLGIELSSEEIKDKKLEDIISLGKEKLSGSIEELKKKGAEGSDKKLQDALKAQEDLQKKLKDHEELLANSNKLLNERETSFNNEIKTFKINHKVAEIKGKFQYSDTVDDFKKRGFDAIFNEKYAVDMENDNLVVLDRKTGSGVKNATGTGFLSLEEVMKKELEEAKMLKANGAASGVKTTTHQSSAGQGNGQGSQPIFTPNPKAVANADRMRSGS